MQKNYFTWLHLVNHLKDTVQDKQIESVFSQEKEELILLLSDPQNRKEINLRISINYELPYMILADKVNRLRNSAELFPEVQGKKINSMDIIEGQRIIRIEIGNYELWINPFGSRSNVILRNSQKIVYFKKNRASEPWHIKPIDYQMRLHDFADSISEITTFKDFQKVCPVLNPVVFKEALMINNNKINAGLITQLSNQLEMLEKNPVYICYYDPKTFDYRFSLFKMQHPEFCELEEYASAGEAIRAILFHFAHKRRTLEKRQKKTQVLSNELIQLEKSRDMMKAVNLKKADKEKFRLYGDLLKANLNRMNEGMEEIEVDNIFSEKMDRIIIPLKKNQSPEENAAYYYNKINAFTENRKILNHRIRIVEDKINSHRMMLKTLQEETDFRKINKVIQGLEKDNIKSNMKKGHDLRGIRKYKTPDNWEILVGKDDIANDRLTFKIGRNKDIWMHAHGVSGSHVLILNRDKGIKVPKEIIKMAAGFAAHFSKAKNAGTVPVIYTEVRFVRKPKGAKPGTVTCQQEKTVFAKPTPMP